MTRVKYIGIFLTVLGLVILFVFLGGRSAGVARTLAKMRKKLTEEKIAKKERELNDLNGLEVGALKTRLDAKDEIASLRQKREQLRKAAEDAKTAREVMDLFRSIS